VIEDCRKFIEAQTGTKDLSPKALQDFLSKSPAAKSLCLTERVVEDFFRGWRTKNEPCNSPPTPARPASPSRRDSSPSTIASLRRSISRMSPGSHRDSSPNGKAGPRYTQAQFVRACEELHAFGAACFKGVIIVGNGRSVLASEAGPMVDQFATVVRFNDYVIEGFEKHIGSKVSLWVVSDWTCVKLLHKYPNRGGAHLPVLCAVPWKFMGKPYYENRRAEVEAELTPAQKKYVHFVPAEVARALIEGRNFGDRWPSSGLITIMHMLRSHTPVRLHGFDFFKEIDGKIHYMEDTHKANHHAAEEERICLELVQQGKVQFIA